MDKFYMCYVEDSLGCGTKHFDRAEAIKEDERLLRLPLNNGKKVYLLESVGYVHYKPMPIKWEMIGSAISAV